MMTPLSIPTYVTLRFPTVASGVGDAVMEVC